MEPSSTRADPPRHSPLRRPRFALAVIAALVVVVATFHIGGGWYFASQLDNRALSAEARRDLLLVPRYTVEVRAVNGDTITLWATDDARLPRDGLYGLAWDGGWGTVGQIVETAADGSITREFQQHEGELEPGTLAALDTRVYAVDPLTGHGVEFEAVTFEGELGKYPAWFVAGERSTWFIFVHGNGMTRRDGLRILPAIAEAGYPALVPTYRGDEGAPDDPEGRLTYGKHEWRDLEAAVAYALDNGADSVVLEGMSMGGAVVVAFLLESPLAEAVDGVVLDAPVLDFERAVDHQVKDERLPLVALPLPPTLVDTAKWIASERFGVDWDYANYLSRAHELDTPILLFHGSEDDDVPLATSQELARLRPDLVRELVIIENAGHVEAWNVDSRGYERRVLAFIEDVAGQ